MFNRFDWNLRHSEHDHKNKNSSSCKIEFDARSDTLVSEQPGIGMSAMLSAKMRPVLTGFKKGVSHGWPSATE
jgi:hypothetical protein